MKNQAAIFNIGLSVTHTHINPSFCTPLQASTSTPRLIFFYPVLRLLEVTICSFFRLFIHFLSFLWLIKAPALWYMAKPPGRFYELLVPPFFSFFHCSIRLAPKMNNVTLHTLRKCNSSLSWPFLHPNCCVWCPATLFDLGSNRTEWFPLWRPDRGYQTC